MLKVALTGSIAMGKSETSRALASRGVPVFDSDGAVHTLYSAGGSAALQLKNLVPDAIVEGRVDRQRLSTLIQKDPGLLQRIEAVIHPLVHDMSNRFIDAADASGAPYVVADVPLLFETGRNKAFDRVIVVRAPREIQAQRALARPGMTQSKLDYIRSRQMPDDEKSRLSDYVIDTSGTLLDLARQVEDIMKALEREARKPNAA